MRQKAVILYLISLKQHVTFMEILGMFVCSDYVSQYVQSFKGFG